MKTFETLPKMRETIAYDLIEENGEQFAILYDSEGYIAQPAYIPAELLGILDIFDGTTPMTEFVKNIKSTPDGNEFDFDSFNEMIDFMDNFGFFETPAFDKIKADVDVYLNAPARPAVCAGNTYKADPEGLRAQLDSILRFPSKSASFAPKAYAVPHIDFRTGDSACEAYSAVYNSVRKADADLFVIFGTSHYSNDALFMMTDKHFDTPLGVVETDREILTSFKSSLGFEFPNFDTAHRYEHSIELQVVMLKYLFPDREFKILPILCGSFQWFMSEGRSPNDDPFFQKFTENLRDTIEKSGRKAVYIASGDFSHIGNRFDDVLPATELLDSTRQLDSEYSEKLANCLPEEFFQAVAHSHDVTKLCGVAPFYSMMRTAQVAKGEQLSYGVWNDKETESAVTFSSIAFG
jgi:AmmeMemoRadiSam system protein B